MDVSPAARAHRQQACQPMKHTLTGGGGGKESSVPARFQRRPLIGHAHSSRHGAPWMITLAVMRSDQNGGSVRISPGER
jgi:hypothetical protein